MADVFDRASELEDKERENSIQAKRNELVNIGKPAYSHCEDCGEEIAKERQLITGVTRCIECQEEQERAIRRGLR